jgi:hypothetical protein
MKHGRVGVRQTGHPGRPGEAGVDLTCVDRQGFGGGGAKHGALGGNAMLDSPPHGRSYTSCIGLMNRTFRGQDAPCTSSLGTHPRGRSTRIGNSACTPCSRVSWM